MDSIGFFVWLFPLFFLIHDFEELFMAEAWYTRSKEKILKLWPKRVPFGMNLINENFSASVSFGIFLEYLVILLVCLVCVIFNNYLAWYGFFAAQVVHTFTLHLPTIIKFKGYVPGIATLAILLIPSIWILYQANTLLNYSWWEIVLATLAMTLFDTVVTFLFMHPIMGTWSKFLVKFSKQESADFKRIN